MNGDQFKALADPTRRRILRLLQGGDLPAGEIATGVGLAPASLTHHLNLLRQAGLVASRREGQFIVYALDTTVLQETIAWLLDLAGQGNGAAPPDAPAPPGGPAARSRSRSKGDLP